MGPEGLILAFIVVCSAAYAINKKFKAPVSGMVFLVALSCVDVFLERIFPARISYAFLCDSYCVALFVITAVRLKAPIQHAGKHIRLLLVLFLVYMFFEIFNINSKSLAGSAWEFIRIYFSRYVFFFICLNVLNDYANIKNFLKWTFIIILLTGLYALKQHYFGFYDFEMLKANRLLLRYPDTFGGIGHLERIFSTYSDATTCGYALGIGTLIGAVLWNITEKGKVKLFYLLGSATLGFALVFTISRAAYIFLISGLVILAALKNLRYLGAILLLIVVLYAGVKTSGDPSFIFAKGIISPTEDASFMARMNNRSVMRGSLATAFGNGLGSNGMTGRKFGDEFGVNLATIPYPSDSLWVLLLYETGIVGALLFGLLYLAGIIKGYCNYYTAQEHDAKMMMALAVAILGSSLFFWYAQNAHFVYFDCALLAMIVNFKRIEESEETTKDL